MHSAVIVLFIILFFAIWAAVEQQMLVTTKYVVESHKLPKELNHTCFVVLADLHNVTFGKNNRRLIRRIDECKPEFIVIAGDMIDKNAPVYPSHAFTLLEKLAEKYKLYYAYGNHEQKMGLFADGNCSEQEKKIYITWEEFKSRLKKKNVIFLDNSKTILLKNNEKLRITGVSIAHRFFERSRIPAMEKDYLTSLIGKSDAEHYQILIAHNPVYFYDYTEWGADLTISGHLHGGLVRIPGVGGVISPQVKLFPKYHSGNYTDNGQAMIVSRGLGTHSHMPRLFNIPELVSVELRSK
jgi:predicted MPP superfamily phosphohydrolase